MNLVEVRNHQALGEAFDLYSSITVTSPRDILLLSPSVSDVSFLRARFPSARFYVATIDTWDLDQPFPCAATVDLVVASNVFHYSKRPEIWFGNVLDMTRTLVMQDLVFRRRSSAPTGLCNDGDAMRYCYGAQGVASDFPGAFDLGAIDANIRYFRTYEGGRNEYHVPPSPPPLHHCAVIESHRPARSPLAWSMTHYARFRLTWMKMAAAAMLRRSR